VSTSDDKSHIDELKSSLYSRTAPDVRTRRKLRFSEDTPEIKTDWDHPGEMVEPPVELNKKHKDHSMSFFTKLLIGSVVFCLIAVGVGAYLFFNGSNLISADNIDINIDGPVSISGGTPVSFDISIINKNNVNLQLVDMTVDFPVGTTDPNDTSEILQNYTKLIGNLPAGGSARETIKAIIFGEENLQKEITVTLTYGVEGSTSVFTKRRTYEVLINSSPINVSVSSFKEITSGQEFDLKVSLKSNSQEALRNVMLKASYPVGYSFISANLQPLVGDAIWKVGDIPAGGERIIIIHGKISGEDNDTRVFHFSVGAQSISDPKNIGTQYMAVDHSMTVEKPFISLSISVDNERGTEDYVGQFGRSLRVTLTWFNNLSNSVSNVNISTKLSGSAYDKTTVFPDLGFFNSANDEIVWSQKTNPDLASIGAGGSGTVSFTITPKNKGTSINLITNPVITLTANVSGNRTQESDVPRSISSAVTRNILISSDVSLSGRIVRTIGPFLNTGPIPPKAERSTTYTVVWDVDNTSNALSGAQVTATLPSYVKWQNMVSPNTEDVTYDQNSGLVTWKIGNVDAHTLSSLRRKEVAFQVSFTPSINQVGQFPTIVNQATLVATDSFTNTALQSSQGYLTTRFSTDPGYKSGQDMVTK
jgi:hypothetical protein